MRRSELPDDEEWDAQHADDERGDHVRRVPGGGFAAGDCQRDENEREDGDEEDNA